MLGKLEMVELIMNKGPTLVWFLSGFSSWGWFLVMLSLLLKQVLLWLSPASTWITYRHQGCQNISRCMSRKCLSWVGRCAGCQWESQTSDLLPAPGGHSRTSAWAPGVWALGSSVCPTEPPAHISLFWPCGSCLVAGRHVDLCNGRVQREQKPLVFPGWEFSISFIYRVMLGELMHPVTHLVLVLLISHSLSSWHVGRVSLQPSDTTVTGMGSSCPCSQ